VSVGLIPVKPVVKENMVQAFFSFYPMLPSKYYGKKQRKIRRGGGISKISNTSQTVEERTHW